MQIVAYPASIAVLLLAAILLLGNFISCKPRSPQTEINAPIFNQETVEEEPLPDYLNKTILYSGNWLTARQSEELLLLEGSGDHDSAECCPTETIMTSPVGGVNAEGNYVELYRDGTKQQKFYEISCREEIVDKPCRFMEKRYHNRSKCVQKYSYSYAIVIPESRVTSPPFDTDTSTTSDTKTSDQSFPFEQTDSYMLDHIQVRSGCSCEILPNRKLKDKKNFFKGKKKKRKPANETTD